MYSALNQAINYIKYYVGASNGRGHGVHSPFVFEFIRDVLNDKRDYLEYQKIEELRARMLANNDLISIDDLGAGAGVKRSERSIRSIAKHAAKSRKLGQLLFRIVRKYQPSTVIELGTSLGITTSYFSLANPEANITTIEGAGLVADIAKQNFDQLGISNISLFKGNFDDILPGLLDKKEKINLAFIDGNHRLEPTLRYFQLLLPKTNNDSIIIFDDIHWSREMEQAWAAIKQDPSVRCSIDLFFLGIIFFKQEFKEKQEFRIRY